MTDIHSQSESDPSKYRHIEGASLREVLKYESVTEAFMIELDDAVVNVSRQHLKQLNNCAFGGIG